MKNIRVCDGENVTVVEITGNSYDDIYKGVRKVLKRIVKEEVYEPMNNLVVTVNYDPIDAEYTHYGLLYVHE